MAPILPHMAEEVHTHQHTFHRKLYSFKVLDVLVCVPVWTSRLAGVKDEIVPQL